MGLIKAVVDEVRAGLVRQKGDTGALRNFGLVFSSLFGAMLVLKWWSAGVVSLPFAGLSLSFLAGALMSPSALKPFFAVWMTFGLIAGTIVMRAVLVVFFFTVVTPIGLLLRLSGKDTLKLKKKTSGTYWEDADPPAGRDRYEKQF